MSVIIRSAIPGDMPEIIKLCAEHAEFEQVDYNPEFKDEQLAMYLFSLPPRLHCLIAEVDGCVAGYATYMKEFSTWDADFYVHMDCLFVRAAYRGNRIGEELVRRVARYSIREGCRVMQWQTPHFNHRAVKFYHRIGASSKEKYRMYMDRDAQKELEPGFS